MKRITALMALLLCCTVTFGAEPIKVKAAASQPLTWQDETTVKYGAAIRSSRAINGLLYKVKATGRVLCRKPADEFWVSVDSTVPEVVVVARSRYLADLGVKPDKKAIKEKMRKACQRAAKGKSNYRSYKRVVFSYTEGDNAPLGVQGDGNYQSGITQIVNPPRGFRLNTRTTSTSDE